MFKLILNVYRWIFARNELRNINLALFQMSLRGLGILNHENGRVSGEQHLITKVLPAIIENDNPVFFDVGANIGKYSTLLSNIFPNATIYAFEPHPNNFNLLKASSTSNKLKCHNIAVGNVRGELTLYDRADHDGSTHASLHEAVISEIHKQDTVTYTVPVETLDDFTADEKLTCIDFLKIDTEGNELAVLQGASTLIENGNIRCIHFEFNEMNIVSRIFFRDFRKTLCNYDLFRLLPNGLLRLGDSPISTELFADQNIIALPKNMDTRF